MQIPDFAMSLYADATVISRRNNQTVGEKNDNYITLQQLEALLQQFIELNLNQPTQ